jgi:hypothetical protein
MFAARLGEADRRPMKELPDDLGLVGQAQLAEQRAIRDAELAPLFRRWPALSRFELAELRRMYTERLRIARFLGRRRARD